MHSLLATNPTSCRPAWGTGSGTKLLTVINYLLPFRFVSKVRSESEIKSNPGRQTKMAGDRRYMGLLVIWYAFTLAGLIVIAPCTAENNNADSLNEFGLNLHKVLLQQLLKKSSNGNLFYSPFSIGVSLGMVYGGAEGKTQKEIASLMGWTDKTTKEVVQMLGIMSLRDGQLDFKTANGIWLEKGIKLERSFRSGLASEFGSKIKRFSDNHHEARRKINDWVKKHTGGKIEEMIPKGGINANTLMVLINAVYFKGFWENHFDKRETRRRVFVSDKKRKLKAKIPMMTRVVEANLARDDGLQVEAIELDYVGGKFSMVVLLPDDDSPGLATLESKLSSTVINDLIKKMRKHKLRIYLPKFKLTADYELSRVLPGMGLKTLFTPAANLTGMLKNKEQIFVTQALHKSFIEVNEKGTEASAATAIIVGRSYLQEFDASRPFVFFIRDKRSNIILFSGRYANPEG